MIGPVDWQCLLILPGGDSEHRAARRHADAFHLYSYGRDDHPENPNFWSRTVQRSIIDPLHDGKTFVFAFWSVYGYDIRSDNRHGDVFPPDRNGICQGSANEDGGDWTYTAKAYYVWDFRGYGGDNAVYIDAFDKQAGAFIADDFVDVTLDETGTLTPAANNGYIDTDPSKLHQDPITITARDPLYALSIDWVLTFDSWMQVTDPNPEGAILGFGGNSLPDVGEPPASPNQIIAHPNNVVVAFAFYNQLNQFSPKPVRTPTSSYVIVIAGEAGGSLVYINPVSRVVHREPSGPPFGRTELLEQGFRLIREAFNLGQNAMPETPQKGESE